MKCPKCGSSQNQIVREGHQHRRRKCSQCNHSFTTSEIPTAEYERLLLVAEFERRLVEFARKL